MEDARGQLSQPLQSKIAGMHDEIAQFGLGVASLPEARRVQIETGRPSKRRCGSFSRLALHS